MLTCPKCRKQNPPDAAFCGFCGAKIVQAAAPAPAAKTVYGYTAQAAAPQKAAPAIAPAPAPAAVVPPAEATIPLTDADLQVSRDAGLLGGRFLLGQPVKRLPTGELHKGRDVKQELDVEILLVDPQVFPSPLDMERGRRELRQLQKVECQALVKIHDHGKMDDGRLFIALEPAHGTSLDELIARGPLTLPHAQQIIREVGNALAEAQKMGVIHRDIAPHNIVLGAGGEVRLRGFAVAAPIKKHIFGTAEFISPEQASGRPVDQRSNIYSLGALLYFLLSAEPPFRASSPEEQLEKHQHEEPTSPRTRHPDLQISPRAEALMLKALAKSSSRRHLTLRQFLREVESLTDATPLPEEAQPLSFVTPLHGMTALTGGRRPPSSEIAPAAQVGGMAAETLVDAPPVMQPPERMRPSLAALEPALEAPAAAPPPPAVEEPVPLAKPKRQSAITGEMSSDVSLKQAPPAPARQEPPRAVEPPPPAAAGGQKPGFRETMWFFKGEVESAIAETGGDAALQGAAAAEATPQELTEKYADDGSLTDEEARRLSLRTGKTQMMQQVKVPRGQLPGDKMGAEDFIHEMNRGRKIAIWSGVVLVLAVVAGLIFWLVTK